MANIIIPNEPRKNKLTAKDIDDLQKDLVFAAEVLFGHKLTTATRCRFKTWQQYRNNYDCSGWASFKTYSAAIFAATCIAVFDDWHHGIVGLIARTAQRHFAEIEDLYHTCPLFRGRMAKPPTHQQDGFELKAQGGSRIIAVPADILKRGQRLESESFNSITCEEFTRYASVEVLDIIDARLRRPNKHKDILDNWIIYLGSAEDADAEIFRTRIQPVTRAIIAGDKSYSYSSYNVEILSNYKDCLPYLDLAAYENAKKTMSPTRLECKWLGRWRSGAGDIYPGAIWSADSLNHWVTDKAAPGSYWVCAYDVAMRTDKFAMKGIQVGTQSKPSIVRYGYSFRPEGSHKMQRLAKCVYDDYEKFGPSIIVIDAGGGGWALIEALVEYAEKHGLEPLVTWNGNQPGRAIVHPFTSNDMRIKHVLGRYDRTRGDMKIEGDDHLKCVSHEACADALEMGRLLFASSINICKDNLVSKLSPITFRRVEEIEEPVLDNFEETKAQAKDLKKDKDRDGNIRKTAKGYYVIKGVQDDDIQALVYGNAGVMIYKHLFEAQEDEEAAPKSLGDIATLETDAQGNPIDPMEYYVPESEFLQ